jgi:hypothetical protein
MYLQTYNTYTYTPSTPNYLHLYTYTYDRFYFDSDHVGVGDVIRPGSVTTTNKFASSSGLYLMYIFGGNGERLTLPGPPERVVKGTKIEVGIAVSQDGAHWSRIEGEHVEQQEPPRGSEHAAVPYPPPLHTSLRPLTPFPVSLPLCLSASPSLSSLSSTGPSAFGSILEVGKSIEDFDALFVGWPSVLPPPQESPGAAYTMYYSTMEPSTKRYSIGIATSPDGLLKWEKVKARGSKSGAVFAGSEEPDAFDSRGASRRHVLRQADGSLRMYV